MNLHVTQQYSGKIWVCHSNAEINSKLKEKKAYENIIKQMFLCNDKVKRTAIIKPTNKLNINKYFLILNPK